jgi:hypothetical protein
MPGCFCLFCWLQARQRLARCTLKKDVFGSRPVAQTEVWSTRRRPSRADRGGRRRPTLPEFFTNRIAKKKSSRRSEVEIDDVVVDTSSRSDVEAETLRISGRKLLRAYGGCLGVKRRRRTWNTAKSLGEPCAGAISGDVRMGKPAGSSQDWAGLPG